MASKKQSRKAKQQQVLLSGASVAEQPGPAGVVNGRMLVEYVKPHFTRDRNDDRFIALEFSMKLTEAHQVVLPKSVLSAWEFLRNGGAQEAHGVEGIEVKPQTLRIFGAPDAKDDDLIIVGATITKAKVSVVEERGKGEAVKFTRYNFRALDERGKNNIDFACWNDGKQFWLEMKQTQASLL